MVLKRLFGLVAEERDAPFFLPEGERLYAIGDIHGRSDLLDSLIARIESDDASRNGARVSWVFLGDFIDRGPDSVGVVDRLIAFADTHPGTAFLMGNHEEVLLRAADGDTRAASLFHRIGGRETLLSYGVDPDTYDNAGLAELCALIAARVPVAHMNFLRDLKLFHQSGDYLFVHAGIRPEVALEEQQGSDLRWIREEFLGYRGDHGRMVVHGHSISTAVDVQRNRIGIDTGAYASDCLTAIGLQAGERWFLSTGEETSPAFQRAER